MFYCKKNEYLNCDLMKHSIHFFYDEIRACCANAPGPVFFTNIDSDILNIDWNNVYNIRKKYVKTINSCFNNESVPKVCKNCFELKNYLTKEKVSNFKNEVTRLYIQNFQTCNLKCTYCTFADVGNGLKYKVTPIIKSLIDNNILSQNALIYLSGGEITISPEFEDLFSLLYNYVNSRIEILTGGVKYSESIQDAFIRNRCSLLISIDSGCRETYKKIKQVDLFDTLLDNLKKYTQASYNAKENITLKYIIVDNVNDNIEEINKFFDIVMMLGIKNVRIDVDFQKYSLNCPDKNPPVSYIDLIHYFNNKAENLGLNICTSEQVEAILSKIKS